MRQQTKHKNDRIEKLAVEANKTTMKSKNKRKKQTGNKPHPAAKQHSRISFPQKYTTNKNDCVSHYTIRSEERRR